MTRRAAATRPRMAVDGCPRPHSLVTGTFSGIGRATALRLIALGHHVYAGLRQETDAPQPPSGSPGRVTPVVMDVTSPGHGAAVARLVDDHTARAGLDAVVNDAGIALSWPLELVPLDLFRQQLEANVTGQLSVIQAFLPAVRRAQGAIAGVGSVGGRLTMPFAGPLIAAKRAVAALAGSLRQGLAPSGVKVVPIEPGSIRTPAVDKLERDARTALASFPADGRARVRAALHRGNRGSGASRTPRQRPLRSRRRHLPRDPVPPPARPVPRRSRRAPARRSRAAADPRPGRAPPASTGTAPAGTDPAPRTCPIAER